MKKIALGYLHGVFISNYTVSPSEYVSCLTDRYDLLHNAHLNLEGLDELFQVAQVQFLQTVHSVLRLSSKPLTTSKHYSMI